MNRLTDAELEAMRPDLRSPWVNPKMLKAAPAMYAELLERRAMDAVVREALEKAEKHLESWPHSLGAEYSGLPAIRAALAPYREKADAAE